MTETIDRASLEAHDRVRLPMSFDVAPVQSELLGIEVGDFVYYDVIPLTGPAHIVDPSLPPPPPADDFADGTWTPWLRTKALSRSATLSALVDEIEAVAPVTLVRLLRLAPGAVVDEHTDPALGLHIERSVVRLTIPIITNPGATLYLNDEPVPLAEGECWYLRFTDPHRVVNQGTDVRVHLSVDVRPNDWLLDQLRTGIA